jgi:hypothetical protein
MYFFWVNSDELVMGSGRLIRGRGLAARVKIGWIAHHRSALVEILNKIFRNENIQGNDGAITKRPHTGKTLDSHGGICLQAISLLRQILPIK